jgi:hypothetical protein
MSISYTFSKSVNDGVAPISKAIVVTADLAESISTKVVAGTNTQIGFALTTAKLEGIFINADQACTMKTNSTTGVDVFSLKANDPLSWMKVSGYFANPFTQNVTNGLYITNTTDVNITIRSISDI